jgi:hypothetical protein
MKLITKFAKVRTIKHLVIHSRQPQAKNTLSSWANAAVEEDQRDEGCTVPADLARCLDAVFGTGCPPASDVRTEVEKALECNLSRARVLVGAEVDRLAGDLQAEAFSIDCRIFFSSWIIGAPRAIRRAILAHELVHVAADTCGKRIKFWGGDDHHRLTAECASKYLADGFIINEVVAASDLMDLRSRRLMRAALPYLAYMAKLRAFPGEGPEHGEGGMYQMTDEAAARRLNENCAKARLTRALAYFKEWRDLMDALCRDVTRVQEKMSTINEKRRGMVENFADALHIAQDRGSHCEGVKDRGHDDPRCKETCRLIDSGMIRPARVCTGGDYDPDNPRQNTTGFQNARKYTDHTFQQFKTMVAACPKMGTNVRLFR